MTEMTDLFRDIRVLVDDIEERYKLAAADNRLRQFAESNRVLRKGLRHSTWVNVILLVGLLGLSAYVLFGG